MVVAMLLSEVVCVVAAAAMTLQSGNTRSRTAHAIMLAAMVALTIGMTSPVVQMTTVLVLLATGGWMLRRPDHEGSRSCALDLASCAVLVGLMGLTTVLGSRGETHASMPGMTHGSSALSGPVEVVLVASAVGVVVGWAVLRRRTSPGDMPRGGSVAAWSMMLAMATMTLA